MTWRPASARLWRPGQVTAEQREEIEQMIAAAVAARAQNQIPELGSSPELLIKENS